MLSRIAAWLRAPEPGFKRAFWAATALALAIACLAGVLRFRAMQTLPMDWDELVYLRVAYVYAQLIEHEEWGRIPQVPFNPEHPPLVKLAYGFAIAGLERNPPIKPQPTGTPIPAELHEEFHRARLLSVAAGTAQVYLVALLNPLAGLFLAIDGYHIRYTSEILLEAIPGFFAVLAVALFGISWRPRENGTRKLHGPLLWSSAVSLGLAVSGKYTYALVAFAILPFLIARAGRWRVALGYVALALLVFFATNPALWLDPIAGISKTFSFHARYSGEYARAWWHPLALMTHLVHDDHHAAYFSAWPDRLLLVFAAIGVVRTARLRPTWLLWALLGMAFLLAWPTKWAHYPLLALPAFAMCAGYGLAWCAERLLATWRRLRTASGTTA
ncbi:MAG: hypothetical protein VCB42_10655 [Myxococcota bacterium]